VAELFTKKKSAPEILQILQDDGEDIDLATVIDLIKAYMQEVADFSLSNPDFLDKRTEHIISTINELDLLLQEQWSHYESLIGPEAGKAKNSALANINKILDTKAKVLGLQSSAKEIQQELERVKRANRELVRLFKEATAGCPLCTKKLKDIKKNRIVISGG
jgi:hypothetical protein